MKEYERLQRKLAKTRRRIAKQELRLRKQKNIMDSFVILGKSVPGIYEYNFVNMQRKLWDLQGLEQYLIMAVARQEQNI